MTVRARPDECTMGTEIRTDERMTEVVPSVVEQITRSCGTRDCFEHVSPIPLPNREPIIDIIHLARRILFPGYFTKENIDPVNLEYYLGQEITTLFNKLSGQITWAVRHDCFRYQSVECVHCSEQGRDKALRFIELLPELRLRLAEDVRAAYEGDPSSRSYDQIIFCFPGLLAVTVYRIAHELFILDVPLIPRIMTEYAHSETGIDIHPGAVIGDYFFIDHGTGVVIGETTTIGDRVRLYQGVTLGALSLPRDAGESLKGKKRHPTIENDVIIYAGATILGGETVIGERSVIGGNVWLTESVPPGTKVILKTPELLIVNDRKE